jgi:hypothetical protein
VEKDVRGMMEGARSHRLARRGEMHTVYEGDTVHRDSRGKVGVDTGNKNSFNCVKHLETETVVALLWTYEDVKKNGSRKFRHTPLSI